MMRCSTCDQKFKPSELTEEQQLNYWKQNRPYKDFRRVCGNCYVSKDNLHNFKE